MITVKDSKNDKDCSDISLAMQAILTPGWLYDTKLLCSNIIHNIKDQSAFNFLSSLESLIKIWGYN